MIYPKLSTAGKAKTRFRWLLAFGVSVMFLAPGIVFSEQDSAASPEQGAGEPVEQNSAASAEQGAGEPVEHNSAASAEQGAGEPVEQNSAASAEQGAGEPAEQKPAASAAEQGAVDSAPKHPLDEVVVEALQMTPDIDKGQALYYQCALCHTPEGWGSPNGRYPQIAGQHKSVILKQMADIHKGNRDNPTMIPFTPPLFQRGPQALADMAAYIEQLPMVPNNSIGTGMRLDRGKTLYEENCKECHGDNGEGDAREFYPRIQGQHFRYLLRQMEWIKIGKRRNADQKMMEQIEGFRHVDIAAIADYVSRMKPDKDMVADHMDWRNPDFRRDFRRIPRSLQ